jgi:hypothetical protein
LVRSVLQSRSALRSERLDNSISPADLDAARSPTSATTALALRTTEAQEASAMRGKETGWKVARVRG